MAESFQFGSQFPMVVDLAIEDDGHVAIFRENGLVPGTEIDNLEPGRSERAEARLKHTLLVRATVKQCGGRIPNAIGIRCPMFVGETDDSAQVPCTPSKSRNQPL